MYDGKLNLLFMLGKMIYTQLIEKDHNRVHKLEMLRKLDREWKEI